MRTYIKLFTDPADDAEDTVTAGRTEVAAIDAAQHIGYKEQLQMRTYSINNRFSKVTTD